MAVVALQSADAPLLPLPEATSATRDTISAEISAACTKRGSKMDAALPMDTSPRTTDSQEMLLSTSKDGTGAEPPAS